MKLYREYGIRVFKIDGLSIPTKKAETNLRKFFDTVLEKTDNQVVFNLDVTAGRRGGYNMFNEYGNIFLENRYTDWGNYYPTRLCAISGNSAAMCRRSTFKSSF